MRASGVNPEQRISRRHEVPNLRDQLDHTISPRAKGCQAGDIEGKHHAVPLVGYSTEVHILKGDPRILSRGRWTHFLRG